MCLSYGQCHRGLCIQHQHKDVRVQTMVIDPVVQIGRHVHAGRVDKHNVVAQQTALLARPKDPHFGAFAKLVGAQRIGQLLDVLN